MTPFEWNECSEAIGRLWPKVKLNNSQLEIWKEQLKDYDRDVVMKAMKAVFSSGEYPRIHRVIKAIDKGRFTGGVIRRERVTDRQMFLQLLTAKAPQRLGELELMGDADLEITYHRECYNRAAEVYQTDSPSLKALEKQYHRALDRHGREVGDKPMRAENAEQARWKSIGDEKRKEYWNQIRQSMNQADAHLHRDTSHNSTVAQVLILAAIDDPNQQHGGQY
jgi:hypothetical protein